MATTTTHDFTVKLTAEIVPRDTSPPLTSVDYRTDEPRHNAQVFMAVTTDSLWGINSRGIVFETLNGDSPVSNWLGAFAKRIRQTDVHNKLDSTDCLEAAAMLFNLLPAIELENV